MTAALFSTSRMEHRLKRKPLKCKGGQKRQGGQKIPEGVKIQQRGVNSSPPVIFVCGKIAFRNLKFRSKNPYKTRKALEIKDFSLYQHLS